MKIKNATAQYTGGNIYIYYGELENGLFFRAGDGEEYIEICDADTSTDEADYYEFYKKHSIKTLTGDEYIKFWNNMLLWIIHNAPSGNYQVDDLDERMIEEKETEYIKLKNDGFVYISEKGIEYELLEGFTIGRKERYTSDIIFITLMNADYDIDEIIVGYLYGAHAFANNPKEYQESIKEIVEEFEKKHFEKTE